MEFITLVIEFNYWLDWVMFTFFSTGLIWLNFFWNVNVSDVTLSRY